VIDAYHLFSLTGTAFSLPPSGTAIWTVALPFRIQKIVGKPPDPCHATSVSPPSFSLPVRKPSPLFLLRIGLDSSTHGTSLFLLPDAAEVGGLFLCRPPSLLLPSSRSRPCTLPTSSLACLHAEQTYFFFFLISFLDKISRAPAQVGNPGAPALVFVVRLPHPRPDTAPTTARASVPHMHMTV